MCLSCLPPFFFLRITKREMQRARKWQAVLAISFLLVTSSVRGISEVPASERRTLLDLIEQVAGDSSISSSRESGRVVSRRYNVGVAQSAEHANRRLSSRERSAASPRSSSKRPTEIFSRDSTLKEKFLNHFTAHSPYLTGKPAEHTRLLIPWEHLDMTSSDGAAGRVIVSAECTKQFLRLYHNTKDCLKPTYVRRCARLLTRLAQSPLCAQQ
ncbi:ALK and LTK ligand 1 isoform X3 [Hyperolius riggenbachi]|uniref:ALK and LTK ligand 1 isoform X3 n=1 Tax=Hyperolius riggenbachi TaxID=752182 RepID=UPI0035A3B164